MLFGSAIAARTKRVRIGMAVAVLPLCNPLRVAEESYMLDQISGGRFDLGVGRSGITKFYDGYNVPYEESRDRFNESLNVIMEIFTHDPFSFEGQYYSFKDVTVAPEPHPEAASSGVGRKLHAGELPHHGRTRFPAAPLVPGELAG